ncbi:MAG TPA: hypothetical protein VFP39_06565 [Gemmatimonadales bacterium]|nr:hypothetical protein [Gemmatimonadales bacterium]
MAARVREFIRARSASEPGYPPVLARLDELIARAEVIAGRQHQGVVAAQGAFAHRRNLRDVLHRQLVHYLVALGTYAGKDQADLARQFRLPSSHANNTAFLTAVKALVAAAESQRDLLIKQGMAVASLDEINRLVTDFEAASEVARTARRDHIGARADLDLITAQLMDEVNLLEGITRYRFGNDPEVMVEWKAARRVLGQPRAVVAPAATEPSNVQQAA